MVDIRLVSIVRPIVGTVVRVPQDEVVSAFDPANEITIGTFHSPVEEGDPYPRAAISPGMYQLSVREIYSSGDYIGSQEGGRGVDFAGDDPGQSPHGRSLLRWEIDG